MARMARDFLALGGSSACVERVFSASGGVTERKRSSQSSTSVCRRTSSKIWLRDGFEPLAAELKGKRKEKDASNTGIISLD